MCEGGPMTTQTHSIEEQTQAFVTGAAAAMPAEVMTAFVAEQVSLDDAGVPAGPQWWGSIGGHGARTAISRYAPTKPNWRRPSRIGATP